MPARSEELLTAAILAVALAAVALMVWVERRPRDISKPRLLPTTPIMFAAFFMALLAAVHLVNLFGVQTGR